MTLTCLADHGHRFLISQGASGVDGEPYDHGKDTEDFFKVTKDFYEAMKVDTTIVITYEVIMVTKVGYSTCFSAGLSDPCRLLCVCHKYKLSNGNLENCPNQCRKQL